MASTTDLTQMFKYTYGPDQMQYLASEEIVAWKFISREKIPIGGRGQWIESIQKQNAGVFVGNLESGAKTTRRANPSTMEATFSLQEFHGVFDISWKLLQDARKSEYAFEKALDILDDSFKRRTFRALNADILGTGLGELGIFASAQDTTTPTTRALCLCDQGMIVDVMSAADNNTKLAAARTVTDVDPANRTITLSGAAIVGSAAGDYITLADSVSSAGSLHMNGMRAWISTANPAAVVGNLGNIDRAAAGNKIWQSTVLSNGGVNRSLTEDLLLQAFDQVRERGGTTITDFMSNLNIIRRYHEQLRADVFFSLNSIEKLGSKVGLGRSEESMKSGKDSMGETPYQFSGIPWRAEPFFDSNKLVGLNRTAFKIAHGENEMPQPISEIFGEGNTPYFSSTPNTTFEVVSYWQGELVCLNPMKNFMIADVAES